MNSITNGAENGIKRSTRKMAACGIPSISCTGQLSRCLSMIVLLFLLESVASPSFAWIFVSNKRENVYHISCFRRFSSALVAQCLTYEPPGLVIVIKFACQSVENEMRM